MARLITSITQLHMINRANETIPPPLSHDIDNRMRLRITLRILFLFIGCVFLSVPLRYPLIRWKSIVHSRESSSRDEILQILDVITMGSVSSFLGRVQITSSCLFLQNHLLLFQSTLENANSVFFLPLILL